MLTLKKALKACDNCKHFRADVFVHTDILDNVDTVVRCEFHSRCLDIASTVNNKKEKENEN